MASYNEEMKNSVISKALSRGHRSLLSVSEEVGIPQTTIAGWLAKRDKSPVMKKQKITTKWNPEQKLKALIESASLSEPELGAYLRKEGLFSHQLEEWKKEFLSSMTPDRKLRVVKDDRDKQIKVLEREILRKDKALAEAAAIIILQKKVNLLWGYKDEDEK
jgi:hypothetical protein